MEGERGGNDVASKGGNAGTHYQPAAMSPAERMAYDDAYADLVYGAARARGERVQTIDPAFTGGSRDPQTAIEEKKLERHLRRQADLEAERRKFGEIVRDDETGQYLGPTEEGKQALEDYRFQKLPRWQVPLNEVDRWWQQMKMAGAIYGLREAPPTRAEILADIEAAEQRAKQTPWLTQTEKHILANKDRLLKIADTLEERAFRDLWSAHARFQKIPNSPALRKFAEAGTAGEKIDVLLDNPLEFLLVKGGQALPKMAARTAGRFLGGPFGGALAATYMAFGTKHAEAVVKGFADKGIDLQDEAAVRAAVANKELMREIYHNAFKEAGIAAADQAAWEVLRLRIKSTVLGP